jgi:type IV secretory pathway VirB10-like protein
VTTRAPTGPLSTRAAGRSSVGRARIGRFPATDSVIGDYLSIGPVIYVDQGARVTVMVDRDLEIF